MAVAMAMVIVVAMAVAVAGVMVMVMVMVMAVAVAVAKAMVMVVAVAVAKAKAVVVVVVVAGAVAKAMAVVNFFLLERCCYVKLCDRADVFSGCFCGLYREPKWPRSGADKRSSAVVLGRGCESEPDGYDRHNVASGVQISDRCGSRVVAGGNRDPRL